MQGALLALANRTRFACSRVITLLEIH